MICRECLGKEPPEEIEMDYIATLDTGDEEGRGSQALYQCSECKTVGVE